MAGYSGTPLARKLGIQESSRVLLVGAPQGFEKQLQPLPADARVMRRAARPVDVILLFCPDQRVLLHRFPRAQERLDPDGGLWVAWPKKASGVPTDLDFEVVQTTGLGAGLVDTKICSVDDIWSGLRFIYRLENRPALRKRI